MAPPGPRGPQGAVGAPGTGGQNNVMGFFDDDSFQNLQVGNGFITNGL